MRVLDGVDAEACRAVIDSLQDIAPELGHQVVACAFGEIFARDALEPRRRQLVSLGMLTALGACEPQLEGHINAALDVGLTPKQINEAFLHAAVYCGFPRALHATFTARASSSTADYCHSRERRPDAGVSRKRVAGSGRGARSEPAAGRSRRPRRPDKSGLCGDEPEPPTSGDRQPT